MDRWKKVVFGIFATVLLGAFGSGLWEIALRPVGLWLGKAILTGATLGSAVVKDRIYVEAAKGLHEANALQLFGLLAGVIAGASIASLSYVAGRLNSKYE